MRHAARERSETERSRPKSSPTERPSVLLWAADLVGLRQESRPGSAAALQYVSKRVRLCDRLWPYALYNPPRVPGRSRLPVILFLHGAGERGNNGHGPTKVGIGPALGLFPERYPAHVVMPQCPSGQQWSGRAGEAAMLALDETIRATGADERRIYITGISMGACGALRLAARHPDRFAAVVPICGWGDSTRVAQPLKNLPIWFFHGADDPIVPVRSSLDMVRALRSEGATEVRYTEYASVGHESWNRAYSDPSLPDWLFAQSR